jgi:hypothetical protein
LLRIVDESNVREWHLPGEEGTGAGVNIQTKTDMFLAVV